MLTKETTIAIVSTTTIMEISPEEKEMIIKAREKKVHVAKRDAFIDEFNDLVARATAEGFTFGCKNKVWSVSKAEPWHDANDNWINLH